MSDTRKCEGHNTYIADKVNFIGDSALSCAGKSKGNLQLSLKRRCDKYKKETWPPLVRYLSSKCPDKVKFNIAIGPVITHSFLDAKLYSYVCTYMCHTI